MFFYLILISKSLFTLPFVTVQYKEPTSLFEKLSCYCILNAFDFNVVSTVCLLLYTDTVLGLELIRFSTQTTLLKLFGNV